MEWLCLNFRTGKSRNLTTCLQGWAGERCWVGGGELCCGEAWRSTKNFHPPLLALISCLTGTWSYQVGAWNGRQEYAFPLQKHVSHCQSKQLSGEHVSVLWVWILCDCHCQSSLLCHWQLWLPNQIFVIAPRSSARSIFECFCGTRMFSIFK